MAYTGDTVNLNDTEQMGAFSGYIRRPTPTQSGMIAQIFGENGDDADTILALSLSKYQDAQVYVNVYLIKDSYGKIMKENEQYPLIASFLGFIRRSTPKKEGMLAQFFAPNGVYADSVSGLSKSDYQDCLVFVDVRGIHSISKQQEIQKENTELINKTYLTKITKFEKTEFHKKEKQFRKLNEILELSDFLTKIETLTALGNGEDFKNWLMEYKTCSHIQETPCSNESNFIEVQGFMKPFNFLPCCEEHKEKINNQTHFQENKIYYEMKHKLLLRSWAWYIMKEKFSYDNKSEPDPSKIIEWATNKKIAHYLPTKYRDFL